MAADQPDRRAIRFLHLSRRAARARLRWRSQPDGQGFAAFGRVVRGMDIVRKIQQSSAKGEQLTPPVRIVRDDAQDR